MIKEESQIATKNLKDRYKQITEVGSGTYGLSIIQNYIN